MNIPTVRETSIHPCNTQLPWQPLTSASFFNHTAVMGKREQLTETSKISSVSSNIRTRMATCRPGGMAGGRCPGSKVLIPRVSGAPRRRPAPHDAGSASDSAILHCSAPFPACIRSKTIWKNVISKCYSSASRSLLMFVKYYNSGAKGSEDTLPVTPME